MNEPRAHQVRGWWQRLTSFLARPDRQDHGPIVPTIEAGAPDGLSSDVSAAQAVAQIRPLGPKMGDALEGMGVSPETLSRAMKSAAWDELCDYFREYPPGSIMGDKSRAMLFALIRMLRPKTAAEIGTYFAGGAEVMACALWANGEGTLHTTDPFGAERCPAIMATWPDELRAMVQFHPLNSMDFLIRLHHQGVALDFVLVDGDHDYEPVLFDLQMSARLLRPGGVVVLNDSVQTGPFQAARTFLAANPAWRELGTAIKSYDENSPFVGERVSQPGTGLVVLQAPDHWSVNATPRSWGQANTSLSFADGLSFDVPPQVTAGTLHYQAILRLFGDGAPLEVKGVGSIPMRFDGAATTLVHQLATPLALDVPQAADDVRCTFEIELSWRADPGCPPLALASIPAPCATQPPAAR
jgi:predicted O-methyltransferase YrrM